MLGNSNGLDELVIVGLVGKQDTEYLRANDVLGLSNHSLGVDNFQL